VIPSRCVALLFCAVRLCAAADLTVLPDSFRFGPTGQVIEPDRAAGAEPAHKIVLEGARGGFVSCQLAVSLPVPGPYRLDIKPFPPTSGLQLELYRQWFHYVPSAQGYFPDALVPISVPHSAALPDPDNKVTGQTAQPYWLDIWIPATATPGEFTTTAHLDAAGATVELPITVRVLAASIPPEDAIVIDHNSYGTSWFASQYPKLVQKVGPGFYDSPEFYALIHAYHRVIYEHRGVFHQLGYGHAGKVGPEFAPQLAGSGKNKHIDNWRAYDRHYGPLLDGSAFATTHRGPHPIPYAYLPVNPEWPASMVSWGEPGYEREFVNVVSAMERHFREKGWTNTRFELFFNHKKRYKGFSWDGDEARFAKDYEYMREYARLMKRAVPADSPVKFVFRADVSWTMERQFRDLAGVVNFWVCGGGMFNWYRDAARTLKDRGDIVWTYGGTPPVTKPASQMTTDLLRTWLFGIGGFVRWQTVDPGEDPWFHFAGGGETLVYPGDRFGIAGPLASVRLKIQRNAVQDITLLNSFGGRRPLDTLREEAAQRFNGAKIDEWWGARPTFADTDPDDWSNATIDDATSATAKFANIDPGAWKRVRSYVMEAAKEVK
jgi:hypothetical protein